MNLIKRNQDVYYCDEDVIEITQSEIEFLKNNAGLSERKQCRICCHPNESDALHEMIIALHNSVYIRPHRHLGKSESFHLIEGHILIVLFDINGLVVKVISLNKGQQDSSVFYRLNSSVFHTVIVVSEMAVFHESTNGPFNVEETEFPEWAPAPNDLDAVRIYKKVLSTDLQKWMKSI